MITGVFGHPNSRHLVQPFTAGRPDAKHGRQLPLQHRQRLQHLDDPAPQRELEADERVLFFLPHHTWGIILLLIAFGLVAWYLYRNRHSVSAFHYFYAGSVLLTSYYMLPTRMHERYIFPAIAFLLWPRPSTAA